VILAVYIGRELQSTCMAKMILHITKHGKNRFILSSSSSRALKLRMEQDVGTLNYGYIVIGKSRFIPRLRADKRLEIPANIIRKEHLKSGAVRIGVERVRKGEKFKKTEFFKVSRNYAHQTGEYYFVPLEEIDKQQLKVKILNDIFRASRTGDLGFYYRLNFLVQKDDGSNIAWIKTSEFLAYDFFFDDQRKSVANLDAQVDDVMEEMFEMLMKPYVVQVYFVSYVFTSIKIKNVPEGIRGRNI